MDPTQYLLNEIEKQDLWDRNLTLNRNEFLKKAGSTDTNIYFVRTGSLHIYMQDEQEEHTIRFGYQNSIIASLDSYFTSKPSDLIIQAIKKTELQIMQKQTFDLFLQQSSQFQAIWQKLLEGLIVQQMEREMDLLTSSPLQRYKRVLQRSPQLFQEIPGKYIASYLRMTPETLSRMKKS